MIFSLLFVETLFQVGRVGSFFFILLALSSTDILCFERPSFIWFVAVLILSRRINRMILEYIDYTEPGDNQYS